jgi:hypothetical protein
VLQFISDALCAERAAPGLKFQRRATANPQLSLALSSLPFAAASLAQAKSSFLHLTSPFCKRLCFDPEFDLLDNTGQ